MFPRWWRLGVRPQLTFIVILGAILSTAATLFIADNAIQSYVLDQARTQEQDNMKIAKLVLETQYGPNVSISSDGKMVVDLPGVSTDTTLVPTNNYGRYVLNGDPDFVDRVQQLIGGNVSVYQCANATGGFTGCSLIATTFRTPGSSAVTGGRVTNKQLDSSIFAAMSLDGVHGSPHDWLGVDGSFGPSYFADYTPVYNPQQQLIGVLYVGVPLDVITTVVSNTTVELVLIGSIIMIAGVIFALFFANAIVGTLQRAARQISAASERIGGIASQQSSGAAQQVWAINAINQALENFSTTAKDISSRTDQLALMGNQVLQRRQEISPTQIDSVLAYITRSVRDISVASKQQSVQYDRMTGAMQAVIEIAEQVAGNSQQSSESAERLELVVRQLRQLVGVRLASRRSATDDLGFAAADRVAAAPGKGPASKNSMRGGRGRSPLRRDVVARGPSIGGMYAGESMGMPGMQGMPGGMHGMGMPAGNSQNMGVMPPGVGAMPGGNGWGQMGGVGGMAVAGGNSGPVPSGNRMGMRGAMGGARGGMPVAGGQVQDWRLPPLPEMPPMPQWGNGAMSGPGQGGGADYDAPFYDSSGRSVPPQNGREWGVSGPKSGPGMPGASGAWPRNRDR
jgi:hypothetical protein